MDDKLEEMAYWLHDCDAGGTVDDMRSIILAVANAAYCCDGWEALGRVAKVDLQVT